MQLTSPYNFVPINSKVYYPKWRESVSQDIPFKDGEDGYIEVKIRNVSPLFTRNGSRNDLDPKNKETMSSHVIDANGNRRYFIPGSTIKGMLRATLEIMAFGKICEKQHYTNRWFGFRDINNRSYMKTIKKGKPGWLTKTGDKYFFTPCVGDLDKIHFRKLEELFHISKYRPGKSIWKNNCSLKKEKYPSYPEFTDNRGRHFRIVCTGSMRNKTHELLFPYRESDTKIQLSDQTVDAFLTVYENTPDFGEFVKALDKDRKQQRVPVFYLDLKDGSMPIIGLSRVFRIPFKNSLTDMIRYDQDQATDVRDLCETMFGTISGDASLKGRIQVGHAFSTQQINDNQLQCVEGILGQPKASYFPLYIKQDNNVKNFYKTYDATDRGLAGRKIYRIHKSKAPLDLPKRQEDNNQKQDDNVTTKFYALPPDNTFALRINFHNLKKVEIGALLSALTLHETQGAYHNIGLAKGFGFGKIQIEEVKLYVLEDDLKGRKLTAQKREEYEITFEEEMNRFVSTSGLGKNWCKTEQLTQLVNILREHSDGDVRMMKLGDRFTEGTYVYYKNKLNFKDKPIEILQESRIEVKGLRCAGSQSTANE